MGIMGGIDRVSGTPFSDLARVIASDGQEMERWYRKGPPMVAFELEVMDGRDGNG